MNTENTTHCLLHAIDEISELIYVCDLETYELLYINQIGRQMFHINSQTSHKCYKALQGLEEPCPFCTNSLLEPSKNFTWKYTNPFLGRTFFLKDRLIDWNGRPARMEIAFDITELQIEKNNLQYALDTEKIILECIHILYTQSDLSVSIQSVLKNIGTYLCAERAYIFEVNGDSISNTYEWCAPGISPQIQNLQNFDLSIISPWRNMFSKQKFVVIENTDSIPEPDLRKIIADQNIRRLAAAPLEYEGNFSGFFGVDNPPMEKIQNIISMLDTLRYFIMITFQRSRDAQLMANLSFHDALTGLYNRNKYITDIQSFSSNAHSIGIVFADINGLKAVNDRFGHERGDELIVACTRKLREGFPKANIYRTGGDEFVLICTPISQEDFMRRTRQLREQFLADDFCHAAVGSHWCSKTLDIEHMVSLADSDMYREKQSYYKK